MLAEAYKFEKPCPEVNVTPEVRQEGYEAFVTTDDHLMHLTGITKDQNGTKYYITKNSWGTERNTFGGICPKAMYVPRLFSSWCIKMLFRLQSNRN